MSRPPSVAPDPRGYLLDGRWRVRPDINRIYDGDTDQQVPDKFMQVLVVLIENPGVVSRQELFDAVWTDTFVVDESLTRAISSLRKLLDDDPKNPRIIQTIPKKGYRLLAPVEPIEADEEKASSEAAIPFRPTKSKTVAAALAVVIAGLAAVGWWLAVRTEGRRQPEARRIQITALPGIEEYPALSPAGDRVAFIWNGNDEEPDGLFVQIIGAGPPLRITDTLGHYAYPAWTHDSRHIAFVRHTGVSPGIFMVPATGGAEIELVAADPGIVLNTPTFSPDGRWLVFAQRGLDGGHFQLHRKDLETGDTEVLAPSRFISHGGYRPRFSPDGRRLAFFRIDHGGREIVITTLDGSAPSDLATGDDPAADFDWMPDGEGMVISRRGSLEVVRDDGTSRVVFSGAGPIGVVSVADLKPLFAYSRGRREKNIWQWTPPTNLAGEERRRLIHTTAWDAFPTLSPDGMTMAFLSDRTGTPQLWLASRDGANQYALTEIEDAVWTPIAWSPDSSRIALSVAVEGIPVTRIVEVAGGTSSLLAPPDGGENVAAWAADGNSIYVSRSTPAGEEIWRRDILPDASPDSEPITTGGGVSAVEAPDGSVLYFTRGLRASEIWRCELDGTSAEVVFSLDAGEILTWKATNRGLYVGSRTEVGDRIYRIVYFDFASATTTELLSVPGRLGFALDIDPLDDRTIFFDQTESIDSDIFAIENY